MANLLKSFKEIVKEPKKNKNLIIIILLLSLFIGFALTVYFQSLIDIASWSKGIISLFKEIYSKNFGESFEYSVNVLTYLIYIGMVVGSLLIIFHFTYRKINFMIVATIYIMIILFVIGSIFIFFQFGYKGMGTILLKYEDNIYIIYGNMTCEALNGRILAEKDIICTINPPFDVDSAYIRFTDENGKITQKDFKKLVFIAPHGSNKINFNLKGTRHTNQVPDIQQQIALDTTINFKFLSEEENKESSDRFLLYTIGLLSIIFFSVPTMMVNFKKL